MNSEKPIVIGSDHAGYSLKQTIMEHLTERGIKYIDVGTYSKESCHYPVYAHAVCEKIISGECDTGILVCGTGIGMSIAANKHKGIRAAACSDTYSARLTKMHNNTNIICFGERVVGAGLACDITDAFLDVEFEGGKHQIRIDMISSFEENDQ